MGDFPVLQLGCALAQVNLDKKRLIVAIDFGTTYSGIAYCFPDARDAKPVAVSHWPGSPIRSPKVPTVIKYDGTGAEFKWGALVKNRDEKIAEVKLLLDPNQELPLHVSPSCVRATLNSLPPSKSLQDVAADFMRALIAHGMSQIETKVTCNLLDMFEPEYIISVPAIWSDAAKNVTLEAAKMAGIAPVTLIKEPEAAALYAIRQLDTDVNSSDVIVICDAGGGTVDLISYEVEATHPTLHLKEIVPGNGGKTGSIFLNKRFEEALEEIIPAMEWPKLKNGRALKSAIQCFESEIKPKFGGDLDDEFYVHLPGAGLKNDPSRGIQSNEWCMKRADLKGIFDPVVREILRLIQDQVLRVELKKKIVKAIFLVGGFGTSQYLRKKVEKAHQGIKVVQPDDGWAAIVKGAALSRMPSNAVVTSVSAVRHYGVEASHISHPKLDEGEESYVDYYTGALTTNRMRWYIKIGDDIKRGQKIRLSFSRNIAQDFGPSDDIFTDILYECDDNDAPFHRSKSKRCKINCVLESNISKVPTSKFKKKIGNQSTRLLSKPVGQPFGEDGTESHGGAGKPYWKVHYDLVISFESATMTFSMEIDGETLGSVEARFQH
ncbi:hypothetical protein NLG97_g3918 [Lecanicillium saksenae]|uniref:Uncharacterized protein n=1 Tax=Lecanicillium saksenae TaxID=468837 RepID=A0ACC1QXY7_9HYPO|nr:hypothetical protein NLG97_g3918 [Lecanicillium saksenae]